MAGQQTARFRDAQIVAITVADATYTRPAGSAPITVRLISDTGLHIAYNETATVTHARVPPECIEYLDVGPNDVIHFIRATGFVDGTVWVTEALRS